MKRTLFFCLSIVIPGLMKGQQLAIGGYLTPTFGNIILKKDNGAHPAYQPVFTIGGGFTINYYKDKWMFNSGLNYKYVGASRQLPVTTVSDPDGVSGVTKTAYYFEHIITVPIGIHYAVVKNEKFRIYAGLLIENGTVLDKKLYLSADNFSKFDKKQFVKFNKGYYFGIMPRLGAQYDLSSRKYLFMNLGMSYQLNASERILSFPQPYIEKYKVNNLFIDIGFAYRIKN